LLASLGTQQIFSDFRILTPAFPTSESNWIIGPQVPPLLHSLFFAGEKDWLLLVRVKVDISSPDDE
jgi:hypothetical protein